MGQIFDRSNRARLTQKNAEELFLQSTSTEYQATQHRGNMSISAAPTLVALSAYGQYCQYKEMPGVSTSKTLLRRVIVEGKESLTLVERDQLGFLDRILLFFGHPDFRLGTIQRVANKALRTKSAEFCAEGGGRAYISKAVAVLNACIKQHNSHSILWFLYTKVDSLTRPRFKSLTDAPTKRRHNLGRAGRVRNRRKKQIQRAAQAALGHEVPAIGRIRGLSNPGCLCYSNASLVALYSSPAFREMLKREGGELARLLNGVFHEMGDQKKLSAPLSRDLPGPLQALHKKLCAHRELGFLARYWEQQDAQEFIGPLLDLVFSEMHDKFSVVGHTKRSEAETPSYEGVPPLQSLYLPTIDRGADTIVGNMVIANIPQNLPSCFVRDYFDGFVQSENVEVDAIINNDHNKDLTEAQKTALIMAGGDSGRLDPILVRTSHQLKNPAPSFLPIYIPRFTETGEKNFTPVVSPYRLLIPVEGEEKPAQYELKSVAVHGGATKGGGHYYTYIPDPASVDDSGTPMRWIMASDSSPKKVCSWEQVASDIATQGVFFAYDKIS